jgi:hypothetical protein
VGWNIMSIFESHQTLYIMTREAELSTMKINEKTLLEFIHHMPKTIHCELLKHVNTWERIIKSPFGHSYYSKPKGWGFTDEGTLRLADHWNFRSHGKTHCVSNVKVPNKHWAIGKWDSELDCFVILKVFPRVKDDVRENKYHRRMLVIALTREIALQNVVINLTAKGMISRIADSVGLVKLRYLNKYYECQELYKQQEIF